MGLTCLITILFVGSLVFNFKGSLDELIADGLISQQLAGTVMTTFDKCINKALSERARNKTNFKVVTFKLEFLE